MMWHIMFQVRIPVSTPHVLTPVQYCLLTVTNVSVLWVTKWKMETIRNVRTLTNVKMRVMSVIKNVPILTDLTNAHVDQGTKKSIRLPVRTLTSVPSVIMTVNRFVRTPWVLSCVLVTILTDLDQMANTAHAKKAMREQMEHVQVSVCILSGYIKLCTDTKHAY